MEKKYIMYIVVILFILFVIDKCMENNEHHNEGFIGSNNVKISKCYVNNSLSVKKLSENRMMLKEYLRSLNYPVSNGFELQDKQYPSKTILFQMISANDIKMPLVIRGGNGWYCENVSPIISNVPTLFQTIKKMNDNIGGAIIEEHCDGSIYRMIYFNGSLIDCYKITIPFVVGNGKDTLNVLINRYIRNISENNKNSENIKIMKPIIDNNSVNFNGYSSFDSIVPLNVKVQLDNYPSYNRGAIVSSYPITKIHNDNRIICDNFINKIIKAKCIAIDFLTNDMNVSYKNNGGIIVELNSNSDIEDAQAS
jgi:hypothetical protein